MSLDLFSSNIDDTVNYAARVSAPDLPSTFTQNFDDAWSRGFLTSQSVSGTNRKVEARSQLVDDAIAKTGDRTLASFISPTGDDSDFDGFNRRVAEHNAARPDDLVQPLSSEAIQSRADQIGVQQLSDSRSLAGRERTTGGTIGQFLGTTGAAVTDPVNMVAFPLAAPASLGILGTAMAWAGIGAGSQGVIEALNASEMERIQPGYRDSGAPIQNILEAGVGAAAIGGGIKGLSNLWTRAKTGSWPRTIRDAGNVVESEAQIAGTNPLPGVEGEAAHRTALNKAIDDIANGRPVDIDGIITPDLLERSRGLITRLEAEQPMSLPVINQRAIELTADNQRLLSRDAEIAADLERLPAGDLSAVDRLNRLDAVERQIADTTDPAALRKLNDRRDQILVDTNPETLRQAAAPIEARRMAEAERASIAAQLEDITAEHARMQADYSLLGPLRLPALGQRERIPTGPRGQFELDLQPPAVDALPAAEIPPSIRPEKINTDTATALRDELTPAKIDEMRVDVDLPDTVSRDLDKLMLERPDLEVPTGVTVDAEGRTVPTTRKVESVVAEADARLAAAKEIEACVGPYHAEAAE
jgi:hypothetical protein